MSDSADKGMEHNMAIVDTAAHNKGICSVGTPSSPARSNKNMLEELPSVKMATMARYFLNMGGIGVALKGKRTNNHAPQAEKSGIGQRFRNGAHLPEGKDTTCALKRFDKSRAMFVRPGNLAVVLYKGENFLAFLADIALDFFSPSVQPVIPVVCPSVFPTKKEPPGGKWAIESR